MNEEETFTQFNNPKNLMWVKEDLIYGDWTSGKNSDGIHSKCSTFTTPEVF